MPAALCLLLPSIALGEDAPKPITQETIDGLQGNMNHVWTMVSAALVFLMQCGFLFIEAGMVRSKNAINVAQKNIADMLLSVVMFCLVGFMFMFGSSARSFRHVLPPENIMLASAGATKRRRPDRARRAPFCTPKSDR